MENQAQMHSQVDTPGESVAHVPTGEAAARTGSPRSAGHGASGSLLVFARLGLFLQLFLTDRERCGLGVSGKGVS